MALKRKVVGTIVKLYMSGDYLGGQETDDLAKAIMDEAAGGNRRLIVNMAECGLLTTPALGALIQGHVHYKNRGGEVKLCCLGKRNRGIFEMMKLIMVFDHRDTQDEALAAFAE